MKKKKTKVEEEEQRMKQFKSPNRSEVQYPFNFRDRFACVYNSPIHMN